MLWSHNCSIQKRDHGTDQNRYNSHLTRASCFWSKLQFKLFTGSSIFASNLSPRRMLLRTKTYHDSKSSMWLYPIFLEHKFSWSAKLPQPNPPPPPHLPTSTTIIITKLGGYDLRPQSLSSCARTELCFVSSVKFIFFYRHWKGMKRTWQVFWIREILSKTGKANNIFLPSCPSFCSPPLHFFNL